MKNLVYTFLFISSLPLQAQWSNTASNQTTGDLTIGSSEADSYSQFTIRGPNSPFGNNSRRDITYSFAAAGKARIRAYRGSAWDTNLQFLTSSSANTGGEPSVRMHINGDGFVGVGTQVPTEKLDVRGNIYLPLGQSLGHLPSDNKFLHNNNTVGHYSIGWFSDPAFYASAPTGYLSSYGGMKFFTQGEASMTIVKNGNVGVGTTTPDAKFTVKGDIHAEEVRVDLTVPGPDYVFEEGYDLPTLESLREYVQENKHLPGVPSAAEMKENGVDLGVMNMLLLKKIEELTLYLIGEANHRKAQKALNHQLLERIKELETQLENPDKP